MAKRKLTKFKLNENPLSTGFTNKLNSMIDQIERANNLTMTLKGGGVRGGITHNPKNHSIAITIPNKNIAEESGGGGGSTIQRMVCAEDAPTGNEILCNFYDSNGEEITTGTEGVDYNVPVWCNISNGEVTKVAHATPGTVNIGDTFRLTVALDAGGTDYVEYTATNTSALTVSSNLTSLWNAEVGAEFARVTATYMGSYVRLTADNPGEDFDITGSSVGSTLTMTTITENSAYGNLNTAVPRLNDGDDIMVTTAKYYVECTTEDCGDPSAGIDFEVETRYTCLSNFNSTEQCICSS